MYIYQKPFVDIVIITKNWNEYLSKRTIYADLNKTKQLDYIEVSSNINYAIEIENYLDVASSYEYVFEKKGDHYIFKSINKVE